MSSSVVIIGSGNSGKISQAISMSFTMKYKTTHPKEHYSVQKKQVLIISDQLPMVDLINLTQNKRKMSNLKEHGWHRKFEKTNKTKNKSHPLGSSI
jgi:hypothetical protein